MSFVVPSCIRRFCTTLLAVTVLALPTLGWAGPVGEDYNQWLTDIDMEGARLHFENPPWPSKRPSSTSTLVPEAVAVPRAATYHLFNLIATLEPGEPTMGGKMTRTIWGRLTSERNARVVIHTIGSQAFASTEPLDTVLAVYTGSAVDALTRVVGNDNRRVPGISATYSLVQFDARADIPYHVQMGTRNEAKGEIFANVFYFPPGGGLSAFLAQTSFNAFFNGRDYTCEPSSGANPCPNPTFVVHNSTDQTVRVTARSTIGPGVTPPAPFTLAPGELQVKQFLFTANVDATTVRTTSGHFIFTAKVGATVVSQARHRALIVRKSFGQPGLEIVQATPTVRAGFVNEPLGFTVQVHNPGTQPAEGCHFRSSPFERVLTNFQHVDAATGDPLAARNRPVMLPPGDTATFWVWLASQDSRVADPEFAPPVILDCVNTSGAVFDLSNHFDFTARGHGEPADIPVEVVRPSSGILNVPATGTAEFRVRTINQGATSTVTAQPRYLRPFDEFDANKQFTALVCQTNPATNACLAPAASSVNYTATADAEATFSVFVTAPAVDPGFDPGLRRMFLDFRMNDFVRPNFVGSASVAVRKQ